MDSLQVIHQVESRVGYTLPDHTCDEIYEHGDDDARYIIELYGLPTITSRQVKEGVGPPWHEKTRVITSLTGLGVGKCRKRIVWSSNLYVGSPEAHEEADRIQAKQREEAEEEVRKILS